MLLERELVRMSLLTFNHRDDWEYKQLVKHANASFVVCSYEYVFCFAMWTGEHDGKKINIKDVKAEVKQK
jgi:hypothetical protein